MFQDKYHGEFNLTRSLLANGSIGLIEVTDNVLFSESLAYQLQMPEFKDIRYVYIDLEYAVDPAKKFNDRLEFWTQFLQSLMNHIDNLKLKNKDNHFLIIFDNLSNEHMKVLDSNKKKVFDKKIQSQMLLTLHEGFNNATILGILKDTSQQIEMRNTNLPQNSHIVRIEGRITKDFNRYAAIRIQENRQDLELLHATELAANFEKTIGMNYVDLDEFAKSSYSQIDDFADTKFSECQKSFKYQLKDSKKADFFKFLLKQMLAHKGKENEWVPFAEIEGEDEFDDDDLMELVHEGMIDKLDHKIRFRTNKIYNSVLKYYN